MSSWNTHRSLGQTNGWSTLYRPAAAFHKGSFFVAYPYATTKPNDVWRSGHIHVASMNPDSSDNFTTGLSSPARDDSNRVLPKTQCGPGLASDGENLHLVYQIDNKDDSGVKQYLLHYVIDESTGKWKKMPNLQLGGTRYINAVSLFHSKQGLICVASCPTEAFDSKHIMLSSFYRSQSWTSIQQVHNETTTWEPTICEINGKLTVFFSGSDENLQIFFSQYDNGGWNRSSTIPEWSQAGVSAATLHGTEGVPDTTFIAFRGKWRPLNERTYPENLVLKECLGGKWGESDVSIKCKSSDTPALCIGNGFLMCVYQHENLDEGLWFTTKTLPGYRYKISSIVCNTPSVHPVVDENYHAPYFKEIKQTLWKGTDHYPVAVDMNEQSIELGVCLEPDSSIPRRPIPTLGSVQSVRVGVDLTIPIPKLQIPAKFAVETSIDSLQSLTLRLPVEKQKFLTANVWTQQPWGFKTNDCECVVKQNGQVGETERGISLELYAVSAEVHPYLAYEGLPVDLLRFALLPVIELASSHPELPDYPAMAGWLVHHRTGFTYDVYGGTNSFCNGAGYPFNLERFLLFWKKMQTEEGRKDFAATFPYQKPTLNCIDCTAIVSVCIGLGHKSKADRETQIPHFSAPVGWIKPTSLIGVSGNDTNNPFFKDRSDLRHMKGRHEMDTETWNKLQGLWSNFSTHIFLEYRGKIYDSCAGPALGSQNLEEYFDAAIDYRADSLPATFLSQTQTRYGTDGEVIPELDAKGNVVKKEKLFFFPKNAKESCSYTRNHEITNSHAGFLGGAERLVFDEAADGENAASTSYKLFNNTLNAVDYRTVNGFGHRLTVELDKEELFSETQEIFSVPFLRPYTTARNEGSSGKNMLGQMEYGVTLKRLDALAKLRIVLHIGKTEGAAKHSYALQKRALDKSPGDFVDLTLGNGIEAAFYQHEITDKASPISHLLTFVYFNAFWFTIATSDLSISDIETIVPLLIKSLKAVPGEPEPKYPMEIGPELGSELADDISEPTKTYNLSLKGGPRLITLKVHNVLEWDWVHSSGSAFLQNSWFTEESGEKYLNIEIVPRKVGICDIVFKFHDWLFQGKNIVTRFHVN